MLVTEGFGPKEGKGAFSQLVAMPPNRQAGWHRAVCHNHVDPVQCQFCQQYVDAAFAAGSDDWSCEQTLAFGGGFRLQGLIKAHAGSP